MITLVIRPIGWSPFQCRVANILIIMIVLGGITRGIIGRELMEETVLPKTISLKEGESSPSAKIEDAAWMAGAFKGELFGGQGEEIWSEPSAGSMMGVFKFIKDGQIGFYEILTISEETGSLMLRIKHFNPDLASWEEKEKCFQTPLVKISADTIWFDGFTYIRESDRIVRHIIRQKRKDGSVSEVEVEYSRDVSNRQP